MVANGDKLRQEIKSDKIYSKLRQIKIDINIGKNYNKIILLGKAVYVC